MHIRRTLSAAAAAVLLGLTLASPASAAPASSQTSCSSQTVANNSESSATMKIGANLKKAPYSECGNVQYVNAGTTLYIWCWVNNDYDNFWFWARIAGTSTYGWMSVSNVTVHDMGGSTNYGWCPGEPT
ncbi:hypothetical protein AB0J84_12040 [Micromonospora arborensis]|uniref:hypothetical protein n=1 Tax=Micromonospora arborensis TaxID=2116518 RepID=UPI00342C5AB8